MSDALQALRSTDVPDAALESAAFGEWLLREAGLRADGRIVAVARAADVRLDRERLSGCARRVPWARRAGCLAVVLGDGRVCAVSRSDASVNEGANLAGEERDDVELSGAPVELGARVDPDAVLLRGALVRAAMMASALERISALAIGYASERVQFARPIASFQAVQAHLVLIAQQASLVGVAADAALGRQGQFEIAAAKLLANRAALLAGRGAHQVHGARGVTLEHPLPGYTRRLWAWRSEYGDERFWSERLGASAAGDGADQLYPTIAR
jgi:acyl-CoA dehydrogenase